MKQEKERNYTIVRDDGTIVIPKFKQKSMLDHCVILVGVITLVIFLSIILDLFFSMSVFGLIPKKVDSAPAPDESGYIDYIKNDHSGVDLGAMFDEYNVKISEFNSAIDNKIKDIERLENKNLTTEEEELLNRYKNEKDSLIKNKNDYVINFRSELSKRNITFGASIQPAKYAVQWMYKSGILGFGIPESDWIWISITVFTVYTCCTFGLMVALILFYLRDYVAITKEIIIIIKKLKDGTSETIKDALKDNNLTKDDIIIGKVKVKKPIVKKPDSIITEKDKKIVQKTVKKKPNKKEVIENHKEENSHESILSGIFDKKPEEIQEENIKLDEEIKKAEEETVDNISDTKEEINIDELSSEELDAMLTGQPLGEKRRVEFLDDIDK